MVSSRADRSVRQHHQCPGAPLAIRVPALARGGRRDAAEQAGKRPRQRCFRIRNDRPGATDPGGRRPGRQLLPAEHDTRGATVGPFSRIALSIAAGQQFLAEIEGILLAISAGANIIETHDSTILANTTVVLDGDSRAVRWALTPASPLIAEFDTNVGLAGGASAATYTIFAAGQQF